MELWCWKGGGIKITYNKPLNGVVNAKSIKKANENIIQQFALTSNNKHCNLPMSMYVIIIIIVYSRGSGLLR